MTKREQESMLPGGSKKRWGHSWWGHSWWHSPEYPCTLEVDDGSEAEAFLTCLKTKSNNTDFTGIKGEGRSLNAVSPSKPQPRAWQSPLKGSKQLSSLQSNALALHLKQGTPLKVETVCYKAPIRMNGRWVCIREDEN